MKYYYLLFCILLTACSFSEQNTDLPIEEQNSICSDGNKERSVSDGIQLNKLTNTDINMVCKSLFNNIYNCNDGGQIIELRVGNQEYEYIRFMPQALQGGGYDFFENLTPFDDICYNGESVAEILLCINHSGDYRYKIEVEFSQENDSMTVNCTSFTFLYKEEQEFSNMFFEMDYIEQEAYQSSLIPDNELGKDELTAFYRNCIYLGNMYVLDELYSILPEDDIENRHKYELAASYETSEIRQSTGYPYAKEIFYGESCDVFPQEETLRMVSQSLQKGTTFSELGIIEAEANYDWERVWKIPNLRDYYEYLEEYEHVNRVNRYDLDKDGLDEILFFLPGGSSGNEFWVVLHLDEAGSLTDSISGSGWGRMSLYHYNDNFFFMSSSYDFYDKSFAGYNLFAIDKEGKVVQANISIEDVGCEVIFSDTHSNSQHSFYIEQYFPQYLGFSTYDFKAIGEERKPEEWILQMFSDYSMARGKYGRIDINNDGIDDWTRVNMSSHSRLPAVCDYKFVDGKTREVLDLSGYFKRQNCNLCAVIPYRTDDENYLVCIASGYGNYIIKLTEIDGTEIKVLQSWLVSVKERIQVQVSQADEVGLGV